MTGERSLMRFPFISRTAATFMWLLLLRLHAADQYSIPGLLQVEVLNWMNQTEASIPTERLRATEGDSKLVVVLMDEAENLKLKINSSNVSNSYGHVVLLADILRSTEVGSEVNIVAYSYTRRQDTTTSFTLFARQLEFRGNSRLVIRHNGLLGELAVFFASIAGGDRILARADGDYQNVDADKVGSSEMLQFYPSPLEGPGARSDTFKFYRDRDLPAFVQPIAATGFVGLAQKGSLEFQIFSRMSTPEDLRCCRVSANYSDLRSGILFALKPVADSVSSIMSSWKLARLRKIRGQLESAGFAGDKDAVRRLLLKARDIDADPIQLRPSDEEAHTQLIEAIATQQSRLFPPLERFTMTVQPRDGSPNVVQMFVDGRTLEARIAPTTALLSTKPLIWIDPERPDVLKLYFEMRLTLDPLLAGLATDTMAKSGQPVVGMFADWILKAARREDALRASSDGLLDIDVDVAGSTLQCTISLDANRANLAIYRLNSPSGVPVSLTYECRNDSKVTGNLPLSLSLARRASPEIEVKSASVANRGKHAVSVSHVLIDRKPVMLEKELEVLAGNEAPLQIPSRSDAEVMKLADAGRIIVPPEAVVISREHDPFTLGDFDTTKLGGTIELVNVANLLGSDDKYGGTFDRAEIKVIRVKREGNRLSEDVAGPYFLAGRGATGGDVTVRFIQTAGAKSRFRIEGTAYYDKGRSRQTIRSADLDDFNIKIDESMFVPAGR